MKPPTDTLPVTEQIQSYPRTAFIGSPLNPRTVFPEQYLSELGLSIRNNGMINAVVARRLEYRVLPSPDTNSFLVDWRAHSESPWRPIVHMAALPESVATKLLLTQEEADAYVETLPALEIVAGECRWRASGARPHPEDPKIEMAALSHLQVVVRDLSDSVVREQMLSENMKRRDLTVLEEMKAFMDILDERDAAGQPMHTVLSLAQRIGVAENYVRQRLALKKLTKDGRKALIDGRISFSVARTICRCPEAVVPLVEDEVLNPKKYDNFYDGPGALTEEETPEMIAAKYVKELRGVPFDLDAPNLVPLVTNATGERVEGGDCMSCPWLSANLRSAEEKASRAGRGRGGRIAGDALLCFNPGCLKKKLEIHVSAALVKAKEEGCRVLSDKESEAILNAQGGLTAASPYVKVDEKPDVDDRARSIDEAHLPTWGKIIEGVAKPEVLVAVDKRGTIHKLVDRNLAIAAARKNETDKFLSIGGGRGQSIQTADYDDKKKKEADEAKLRTAQSRLILSALVDAFVAQGVKPGFFSALLPVAVSYAGNNGCTLVAKRRAIEIPKDASVFDLLKKAGTKMKEPVALEGFVFELLLSHFFCFAESMSHQGDVVADAVKPMVKLYEINVGALKKLAAKPAPKKTAEKPAEPSSKGEESNPDRDAEFAKIDAMFAEGTPVTWQNVRAELNLRGTTHAKWLAKQWLKQKENGERPEPVKSKPQKSAEAPVEKAATTSAKKAKASGAIGDRIFAAISASEAKQMTVAAIAKATGENFRDVYVWMASKGKQDERFQRVAPATFALASVVTASKPGAGKSLLKKVAIEGGAK